MYSRAEEGVFVTMQIGVRAINQALVLASDTKCRIREAVITSKEVTSGVVSRSKVVFGQKHDIAVALSGDGSVGIKPEEYLAERLSSLASIPDNLGPILIEWGNDFFKKHCGEDGADTSQQRKFAACTFLVVNPKTQYCCFWKLRVNLNSSEAASDRYMINGNDTNPAIFWPEYMKAEKGGLTLDAAAGIAAVTLLMGSEVNPFGISGLELHLYEHGAWRTETPKQIDMITSRFAAFQESIKQSVLQMSAGQQ